MYLGADIGMLWANGAGGWAGSGDESRGCLLQQRGAVFAPADVEVLRLECWKPMQQMGWWRWCEAAEAVGARLLVSHLGAAAGRCRSAADGAGRPSCSTT
jgi:hypothetical protein